MSRYVDREGNAQVSAMRNNDFVLRMTTPEIAEEYVAWAISQASPVNRARLAAKVKYGVDVKESDVVESTPIEYTVAQDLLTKLERAPYRVPFLEDDVSTLRQFMTDAAVHGVHPEGILDVPDLNAIRERYQAAQRDWRRVPEDPGASRPGDQKGGADIAPDNVSDMNINVYRLLQLADAIHDFAEHKVEWQLKLENDLGVVRPSLNVPLTYRAEKTILRQMTLADIANKKRFIEMMCHESNEYIEFGDESVLNPLWGKDFLAGMYEHENGKNEAKKAGCRAQGSMRHCEIFCPMELLVSKTVLRMMELMDLRDVITKAFPSNPERRFMVDQNALPDHPGDKRSDPFIVAYLLGFQNTVSALDKYHKVVPTKKSLVYGSLWSCDATVHDGARNLGDFSPLNTGAVLHDLAMVQASFDGEPTMSSYGLTLSSGSVPVDLFHHESARRDVHYDVQVVKEVDWTFKRATDTDRNEKNQLDSSVSGVRKVLVDLELKHSNKSWAPHLALKLMGDWGQIEHCKQRGYVFVTCDIIAALYAVYRNVPLLFVNHHHAIKSGTPGSKGFMQYSFAMVDREVPAPEFIPAPPPASSPWAKLTKTGGGHTVNGVLVAVIAACAIISSIFRT